MGIIISALNIIDISAAVFVIPPMDEGYTVFPSVIFQPVCTVGKQSCITADDNIASCKENVLDISHFDYPELFISEVSAFGLSGFEVLGYYHIAAAYFDISFLFVTFEDRVCDNCGNKGRDEAYSDSTCEHIEIDLIGQNIHRLAVIEDSEGKDSEGDSDRGEVSD